MAFQQVQINLVGDRVPQGLAPFRFPPSVAQGTAIPGDRMISVTLDPATAIREGPNQQQWDLRRRGGLGAMSKRFQEETNGRLAVDLSTRLVTQISDQGTQYSGRYLTDDEMAAISGLMSLRF